MRINAMLAAANGLSVAAHLGRHVSEIERSMAPPVADLLMSVLRTGEPRHNVEVSGPDPSGHHHDWMTSWYPVIREGVLLGAAVIATDIAPLKQIERALRRSEARYRTVIESTTLDVFSCDTDGRLLTDMPGWREVTGRSTDALLGLGWLRDVHPADRDHVRHHWLEECLPAGTRLDCEYRIYGLDGHERIIHVRVVPVRESGDEPKAEPTNDAILEWIGTSEDVTPQRLAAQRTASLQRATALLARALTVSDVAQAAEAVGREALGRPAVLLTLMSDNGHELRLIGLGRYEPQLVEDYTRIRLDGPRLAARVARTQEAVLIPRLDPLRQEFADDPAITAFERSNDASWAIFPLITSAGTTLGTLGFGFAQPQVFDAGQQEYLAGLAGQCALALERAHLYERQLSTARLLQQALLPQTLPRVPGVELTARYRSAQGSDIGGDWYDAIAIDDRRVALVLGDVMGRGVRAATIMGQVCNALRGIAAIDERPSEVLTHLDRWAERFDPDEIVTVVYLLVDVATGGVELCNAGHLPPLLIGADGTSETLQTTPGTPLGVSSRRLSFCPSALRIGDVVVLYSDGLVERRDRSIDEGLNALRDAARRLMQPRTGGPLTLDAIADGLLTELGSDGDDDVSLLLVRRVSPGTA